MGSRKHDFVTRIFTSKLRKFPKHKDDIRQNVWRRMEKENAFVPPLRPFGRIPTFKGAEHAWEQLRELDEFKSAKNIVIAPDKALHFIRQRVLEMKKQFFVPPQNLKGGILVIVMAPKNPNQKDLFNITSGYGINSSPLIGIQELPMIDMIITGSVAVSREGHRIGKGKGYADLEYAVLRELNVIDNETVIVTTVHDIQVFRNFPKEIFGKHDVPVDIIITPEKVIRVSDSIHRPPGVFWDMLPSEIIRDNPLLQQLIQIQNSNDNNHIENNVNENQCVQEPNSKFRVDGPNHLEVESQSNNSITDEKSSKSNKREQTSETESNTKKSPHEKSKPKPYLLKLKLMGVPLEWKVRDIRRALKTRDVRAKRIIWKPRTGNNSSFLYFDEKNASGKTIDEAGHGIDALIQKLEHLEIGDPPVSLQAVIVKPVTRIETAEVTSV